MSYSKETTQVSVTSEVGRLRRIIIHSPDEGIGKVIPTKAQDWLFEDIIHLETMRKKEYDLYVKLLLYFLDYNTIHPRINEIDKPENDRGFYRPDHPNFHKSDKVLDTQWLLGGILEDRDVRNMLTASVCALENISYERQKELLGLGSADLASTLISGLLPNGKMIFAPVPNYIFTRDIAIAVKDHILLNRPAKKARHREALLTKYIFFNHPIFANYKDKIIEIADHEDFFLLEGEEREMKRISLEGGDVMMVAPNHLMIGVSERTSLHAASQVVKIMFEKEIVEKVTVIKIPKKRAYMHIDTTFTQVKRNLWVIYPAFSKVGKREIEEDFIPALGENPEDISIHILQFTKGNLEKPREFEYLEDLLDDVSRNDLGSKEPTEFIYSGDGLFPFGQREQWTDSCNVLALKEGVVIGYDRNDKTANGFRKKGMNVVHAADLLEKFRTGELHPDQVENTLILLPSAELSRARGGSHCISCPIMRDSLF
ncbi:MAG: arginine deiminase family protein [Flammeovirgaceae bacterium]|nr:arginine deiminase family protein [Flammeovirgaceae bacterium]